MSGDYRVARVLFVGRSTLFFEGLRAIMQDSELEISGIVGLGALSQFEPEQVDLVLLDFSSQGAGLEDQMQFVEDALGAVPIVILMDELSPEILQDALHAGAAGTLLKSVSSRALIQSLKLVLLGEKVFPTDLAAMLMATPHVIQFPQRLRQPDACARLSGREKDILRCLMDGESNKEIARRLTIAEGTVKVHVKRLLRKINVSNRTQAAVWALSNNVLDGEAGRKSG